MFDRFVMYVLLSCNLKPKYCDIVNDVLLELRIIRKKTVKLHSNCQTDGLGYILLFTFFVLRL